MLRRDGCLMKDAGLLPNETTRLRVLTELGIFDSSIEAEFDNITQLAAKICNTPICLFSLIDRDRQWFKSRVGIEASQTPREYSFCTHAILNQGIMVVNDSREDDRFKDNPLVVGEPHVVFYAGVPITAEEGTGLGALCVIDDKPKILTDAQKESLIILAKQVENFIKLHLKIKQLEISNDVLNVMNAIDPLTKISNRRILFETLKREYSNAIREQEPLSVMLIDVDFFKNYNDHYGHMMGDDCLLKVATSLKNTLNRPRDLVARYGGEEFVVILPNTNEEGAKKIASELLYHVLGLKIEHQASTVHPFVSVSIGLTTFADFTKSITHSDILIEKADYALYQAKMNGRCQFVSCTV